MPARDTSVTPAGRLGFDVATSFYGSPRVAESGLLPVQTSIGKPRFSLGYEIAATLDILAPTRAMLRLSEAAYAQKYLGELDRVGAAAIDAEIKKIWEEQGRPEGVVLLCFEDVTQPHQWCHRRLFSAWYRAQTGVVIPELGDPDTDAVTAEVQAEFMATMRTAGLTWQLDLEAEVNAPLGTDRTPPGPIEPPPAPPAKKGTGTGRPRRTRVGDKLPGHLLPGRSAGPQGLRVRLLHEGERPTALADGLWRSEGRGGGTGGDAHPGTARREDRAQAGPALPRLRRHLVRDQDEAAAPHPREVPERHRAPEGAPRRPPDQRR